jgi:hypothetical protein
MVLWDDNLMLTLSDQALRIVSCRCYFRTLCRTTRYKLQAGRGIARYKTLHE